MSNENRMVKRRDRRMDGRKLVEMIVNGDGEWGCRVVVIIAIIIIDFAIAAITTVATNADIVFIITAVAISFAWFST